MRVRISELPSGTCFRQGKVTRKKLDGDRVVSVSPKGKIRKRMNLGDSEVESVPCPLRLLGVGLRKLPEQVVEMGDGNLLDTEGQG
jgi:hypothetical protein